MESNTLVSVPKVWWAYFWRSVLISSIGLNIFGFVTPIFIDILGITIEWTPKSRMILNLVQFLIINVPVSYLVFVTVVPKFFAQKET